MENAQHEIMSTTYLLKSASIVNEGKIFVADVLIKDGRIEKIDSTITVQEKVEDLDEFADLDFGDTDEANLDLLG